MAAVACGLLPALSHHSALFTSPPLPNVIFAKIPPGTRIEPRSNFGIQMADALFRLVAHPLAVVANVLGQALRAFVGGREEE